MTPPRPAAVPSRPVRRLGRGDLNHIAAVPAPARALPVLGHRTRRPCRSSSRCSPNISRSAHRGFLSREMLAGDNSLPSAAPPRARDPPGGLAHPVGIRVGPTQPHGWQCGDSTPAQIDAVLEGPDAVVWDPLERSLLRAVDETIDQHGIGEDTWNALTMAVRPARDRRAALRHRGLPVSWPQC